MKQRIRLLLACVIVTAAMSSLYIFFLKPLSAALHNMPMASDAQQSSSLWQYVAATLPTNATMYSQPRRNSATLLVYAVTNSNRQEEMLAAVREWQTTNRNMARLSVRFYEGEDWRQFTSDQRGYGGGERLPEVLLREVSVVLSNK